MVRLLLEVGLFGGLLEDDGMGQSFLLSLSMQIGNLISTASCLSRYGAGFCLSIA